MKVLKTEGRKVLIISGGNSSERKISLISAKEVRNGLEISGFKAEIFDLRKGYSVLKQKAEKFDVIFPVLHGARRGRGRTSEIFSLTQ